MWRLTMPKARCQNSGRGGAVGSVIELYGGGLAAVLTALHP